MLLFVKEALSGDLHYKNIGLTQVDHVEKLLQNLDYNSPRLFARYVESTVKQNSSFAVVK